MLAPKLKDFALTLLCFSLTVFIFVSIFLIVSFVDNQKKVAVKFIEQQERLSESAIDVSEFVSEMSFFLSAVILENEGVLSKTDADKIALSAIENMEKKSSRLSLIVRAVNDSRKK